MIDEVLPRRPEPVCRAAQLLFPEEDDPRRRVFWERAVPLFALLPTPLAAKDLYLKGRVHQQLDEPAEAVKAYLAALTRDPRQTGWRLEAAKLLYGQKRLQEAEDELRRVLAEQPNHAEARELLQQVLKEMLDRQ
jgi:tetratricopeptide (TPR) repeat protein